ncbi:MAG: SMC-Scp complex subunit ScpB [Thermotogae bacterium]|nr:SMC-Scp complex subunit ScpB [Thermotogota bacterium]
MKGRGDMLAKLEAMLFAAKRGLTVTDLSRVLDVTVVEVEELLQSLKERYSSSDHGVEPREFGGRWRFYIKPAYIEYVSKVRRVYPRRLSPSQLQVLAAVAVKGEATRAEVERMRMKDSSEQLRELVKLRLLTRKRRGRAFVYQLSPEFYEYFQVEDLSELLSDPR